MASTPVIDSLADKAYVFTNAVSVAPWTLPSAMSVFTGAYPSLHGVINKEIIGKTAAEGLTPASLRSSAPSLTSLINVFKDNGYVTGGFAGGAALSPSYGFSDGFDAFESNGDFEDIASSSARAIDFIRSHKEEKLFIFLHGFDVHGQYVPEDGYNRHYDPPSYTGKLTGFKEEQKSLREQGVLQGGVYLTAEDAAFLRARYEEKVARMDERIGRFLSQYRSLNISRNTIIVFSSNHGDEFYEHGRIDHGMTLFDEVLRVPLIVSVPGMKQSIRIAQQVRNMDILPTLLELVGIRYPGRDPSLYGESLIPAMRGNAMHLDLYPETSYRYATFQMGVRSWDGWKFIYNPESEGEYLFNLSRDPDEQSDVAGKEPKRTSRFMDMIRSHRNTMGEISAER